MPKKQVSVPNTGAWKAFERKIAKLLNTRRTPLSGLASGHHTSSDTLHKSLYVECKWVKGERDAGSAIFRLWEDTVKKAKREGKIPMLAMHKRGTRTEFVAIPLHLATRAILLLLDDMEQEGGSK